MTVTFDFISDLHHEWWDEEYDYAAHKTPGVDMVIVGGDLATDTAESLVELEKIAKVYKKVLFICGNHEFRQGKAKDYLYNFDFDAVEKTLRDGIAKMPNVTYLVDGPFIVDGVAFVGRNAHWNYKLFADKVEHEKTLEAAATSFKSTVDQAARFNSIAKRDYHTLRHDISKLSADPNIREIVVVTHTVPHRDLINLSDKFAWEHQNRMGSSYIKRVLHGDEAGKIKLWLFGHQHDSGKDVTINGVRFHANARGFKSDGQAEYKPSTHKV